MTKSVDNDRIQRVGNEREVKQSVPRTAVQSCLRCREWLQFAMTKGVCQHHERIRDHADTCDQWQGRDKV
jgi:hypothetical protein